MKSNILKREIVLYRIDNISYDNNKEELNIYFKNILESFNYIELNFIYSICNYENKTNIYFGVSRDYDHYLTSDIHKESVVNVGEILKRKFETYFNSSNIYELNSEEIYDFSRRLYWFKFSDNPNSTYKYRNNYVKSTYVSEKLDDGYKSFFNKVYRLDFTSFDKYDLKNIENNLMDKILTSLYNTNFNIYTILQKNNNQYNLVVYVISDKKSVINSIYSDLKVKIPNLNLIDETSNIKKLDFERFIHFNPLKLSHLSCINLNLFTKIIGLPQNEIIGFNVKKRVDFGLNIPENINESIEISSLMQNKLILDKKIYLDSNIINKHIFVTGVTGSGKTTTCKTILKKFNKPFIVIEPAKSEYRELLKEDKDIIVFTLGEDLCNFYINPFELQENETIDSRVGMIKGAILSSFELDAAIPQIIEKAIYKVYEEKGFDFYSKENQNFNFPTFKELIKIVPDVVEEFGFSEELRNNYIGSIVSRLSTFTTGIVKNEMYNVFNGIDFSKLIDKKVVFELDNINDSQEKSFVIAMLLVNINQAIKNKYKNNKNFEHILLIEEAHRFLSKENYNTRGKVEGIRIFTDMLAEVRKYGEGIIIVDQIPSKLVSEVLKNTNTKIVHKLFAKDDKEEIGNTMSLNSEQMDYLSNLNVGEAVVFSQGWEKPILSKIDDNKYIEEDIDVEKKIIEIYNTEPIILETRLINILCSIFNNNLEKYDRKYKPYGLRSTDEFIKMFKILEEKKWNLDKINKFTYGLSIKEDIKIILDILIKNKSCTRSEFNKELIIKIKEPLKINEIISRIF